jgi:hypothetical protein
VDLGGLIASGLFGGIGLAVLALTRTARMYRAAWRLPRTPIARAAHGALVKIVGTATPLAQLSCSAGPCIFYRGPFGNAPLPRLHEEHAVDFMVEDESGQALVRVAGAMIVGKMETDEHSSAFDYIPTGAEVTVIGRVELDPAAEPFTARNLDKLSYREAPLQPVLRSSRNARLRVGIGKRW